jgi:hypothetical protein
LNYIFQATFITTGDLEIWDYTDYDLDADNSRLKRNIEYLKTISLHRDVSLFSTGNKSVKFYL